MVQNSIFHQITKDDPSGFYFNEGLSRLDDNEDLYINLLEKFKEDYTSAPQRLKKLVKEKKYMDGAVLVHTIKGLSGNLGARKLQDSAATLEKILKSPDPGSSKDFIEQFCKDHRSVLNAIDIVIRRKKSADNAAPAAASSEMRPNRDDFQELRTMLLDMDLGASEKLETFMPFFKEIGKDEESILLKKSMDTLNYSEALRILDRLVHNV